MFWYATMPQACPGCANCSVTQVADCALHARPPKKLQPAPVNAQLAPIVVTPDSQTVGPGVDPGAHESPSLHGCDVEHTPPCWAYATHVPRMQERPAGQGMSAHGDPAPGGGAQLPHA